MAIRNAKPVVITNFTGYDTFTDLQEVQPNAFVDSSNVVVSPNGNVLPLRSPLSFNDPVTGSLVLSGVDYERTAGNVVIYDESVSGAVKTYYTVGLGSNTLLRSSQANVPFQSLNVNDCIYRTNGAEFIQYTSALAANGFRVGIDPPAAAPTVSIVSGGSGDLAVGVYVSYAYYNSTTVHTGQCSDASALSGPTTPASDNQLRAAVVASAQVGITNIVLFVSEDGGTTRYLLIDGTTGNPQLFANTTGNITISVSTIFLNFNVEETAFNATPPVGITFISRWKNRIMGAFGREWAYSGFDQISMGVPWESWPPLNLIVIPNRGEKAIGAIETQVGCLCLSDRNAYLLSGTPTDKVDSGANTIQVTEQFDQLGWAIGTRSPKTIRNTPYGTVWLDNNKHLQLWDWAGPPVPLALGIWPDLATIQDTDAALGMAEASWFPAGGANGGFYALTASTSGSTNNRMWFVMMIKTENQSQYGDFFLKGIAPSPSTIVAQCVFNSRIAGKLHCLIGTTTNLKEILQFDVAGDGWQATDKLYCDMVVGNQNTNFNRFHSLELNGTRPQDAIVRVSDMDQDGNPVRYETIPMSVDSGSYFGTVDRYSTRHRMQIAWPNDDVEKREIKSLRLMTGASKRAI